MWKKNSSITALYVLLADNLDCRTQFTPNSLKGTEVILMLPPGLIMEAEVQTWVYTKAQLSMKATNCNFGTTEPFSHYDSL